MKATGNEFGDIYIPEGWRKVGVGETVKKGDLILSGDKTKWNATLGTVGTKIVAENTVTFITPDDSKPIVETFNDRPATVIGDHW